MDHYLNTLSDLSDSSASSKKFINNSLFLTGVKVGRPKSFLAPFLTFTSNNTGPFILLNLSKLSFKVALLSTDITLL